MKNTITTLLIFSISSDDLTPNRISEILGIQCDRSYTKGEKYITPNGYWNGMYNKHNSWKLFSKLQEKDETETHIIFMLEKLEPIFEKIKNLQNVKIEFSCGIQFTNKVPQFFFDSEIIKKIAFLGADLEISLYDMKT